MSNLIKKIKSVIGKFEGYGCCFHCNLTWNVVDGVGIPYQVKLPNCGSGMFPLCTDCFKKLSSEEILKYCETLKDMWNREPSFHKKVDLDVIKYNIKFLKKEQL